MIGVTSNYKQRGITPRAIAQIFNDINERQQLQFQVSVSYMEIYNETVT